MKKLSLLLVAFGILLGICSCDSSKEPSEPTPPVETPDTQKENYTITYVNCGDLTTQTYIEGDKTVEPTKPVKDGYNFDGWFIDEACTTAYTYGSEITSNLTLYGKWTEGHFLTLINDENETRIFYSLTDKTVEPTIENKEGYFFGGWYSDEKYSTVFEFDKKLRKDTTIYAKWNKGVYITYNIDGVETKEYVESNKKIIEPSNPTKAGLVFAGWYTDSNYTNKFNFSKNVTADTTLYAKWGTVINASDPTVNLTAKDTSSLAGYSSLSSLSATEKNNISAGGYVCDNIGEFSKYIGTSYYRTVSTPLEFLQALKDAKTSYTNVWDNNNNTYHQIYNDGDTAESFGQKVHVIEITEDLNLGYLKLDAACLATGLASNFVKTVNSSVYMSDMVKENGISQISIQNTSNLLIYSKNGAKITHAGFKLGSTNNIVIRNLEFDEIWQWEDSSSYDVAKIGDYDFFGWAYFKISFSGYVWIDHCTFGKSYDGQIDYANPVYDAEGTYTRAPYKADGKNGLHISWCEFNAGSDDQNGYLYKMMKSIEDDYQAGGTKCLYYNVLRDAGASFEQILYGLAIPQKKGFLFGDSGSEDQKYNPKINVSFANCVLLNIEDRLPKLRGGDCYMYNCIVDASKYYEYRTQLSNIKYTLPGTTTALTGAKNIISAVKNTSGKAANWKCALVSQGMVPSQDASIMAENCIFKGIQYFIKNNDSGYGAYQFKNCSYQLGLTGTVYNINTTGDVKSDWCDGALDASKFNWNTEDGLAPFNVDSVNLDELNSILYNTIYGVGTNSNLQELFLVNKY